MREGIKIEIIIRDENWKKLDSFKCNVDNFSKVFSLLNKKYGLDFKPKRKVDWVSKVEI